MMVEEGGGARGGGCEWARPGLGLAHCLLDWALCISLPKRRTDTHTQTRALVAQEFGELLSPPPSCIRDVMSRFPICRVRCPVTATYQHDHHILGRAAGCLPCLFWPD